MLDEAPSGAPLVYVVVLNYRNYDDTIRCVEALRRIDYSNYRVVIVENGSDNDSDRVLRERLPDLEVLQTGANLGYAGGNNVGLRHALDHGAEFAVILNNDTLVEPGFLGPLVDHAAADPSAGVLGSLILERDGGINPVCARRRPPLGEIFWNHGPGQWFGFHRGWRKASYYERLDGLEAPLEVEVVSGACMMLRAELIRRIGLLDDAMFLFWEEFVLAERVLRTDFRSVLVPASRVVHYGSGSMKTIRVRAAWYNMQSLNHYLKHYRHVGWLRRCLVMSGPALFFLPGILKTMSGLRRNAG